MIVTVVFVVSLLVAAGLQIKRLNKSQLIPSYQFLAGRELKMSFDKDDWDDNWKVAQYLYSFPSDFNALCVTASAELHSLGFTEMNFSHTGKISARAYLQNVNQSFATVKHR